MRGAVRSATCEQHLFEYRAAADAEISRGMRAIIFAEARRKAAAPAARSGRVCI